MSSAHKRADRGHRLMLVQGGTDDTTAEDGGEDWQDFCRRIGWQPPAPGAEDNLEERLSERLFAKSAPGDNVVRLDLVRAARAAVSADEMGFEDFAPVSGTFRLRLSEHLSEVERLRAFDELSGAERLRASGRSRGGWGRAPFAAAAALAVAAVVFFVVSRLALSGGPSAGFPAACAESAPLATVAPPLDHAIEQGPTEAREPRDVAPPRRAPRHEAKTVKPAPKPTTPAPAAPEPPGAMVARSGPEVASPLRDSTARRADDPGVAESGAEGGAGSDPAKSEGSPADSRETEIETRAVVAEIDSPAGGHGDPSVTWGVVPRYRSGIGGTEAAAFAPAPIRATSEVWANGAVATGASDGKEGRFASASWSLSPAADRWLGASVTPPLNASQASVGAMVQLDLGKAFKNL